MDYAGAALFSRAQLVAAQAAPVDFKGLLLEEMLLESCLGNPHSSKASEDLVERSRDLVLCLVST